MAKLDDIIDNVCSCRFGQWGGLEVLMSCFCCFVFIPFVISILLLVCCIFPPFSIIILAFMPDTEKDFEFFNLYDKIFGSTLERADPAQLGHEEDKSCGHYMGYCIKGKCVGVWISFILYVLLCVPSAFFSWCKIFI
jgi:hypothetical protein